MGSDSVVVLCRNCRQKIALPLGFDSPVFLCPRCQTSMQTPPEVMFPPKPLVPVLDVSDAFSQPKMPDINDFVTPVDTQMDNHFETIEKKPGSGSEESTSTVNVLATPFLDPQSGGAPVADNFKAGQPTTPPVNKPPTEAVNSSAAGGRKSYAAAYAAKGGNAVAKASPPVKKAATRNIRRELVDEMGEAALVGIIKEFIENEISSAPITRAAFLQKLIKKGLTAEVATNVISYAQNSSEGKEIALGTSWTTFYWGLASLVGGTLLNIMVAATTGYIVKYLAAIPLLGFAAVVNAGQKILHVNFPSTSKTTIQALIFLIFILVGGIFFYYTVIK